MGFSEVENLIKNLRKQLRFNGPDINDCMNSPAHVEFIENTATHKMKLFQILFRGGYGRTVAVSDAGVTYIPEHGDNKKIIETKTWEELMKLVNE